MAIEKNSIIIRSDIDNFYTILNSVREEFNLTKISAQDIYKKINFADEINLINNEMNNTVTEAKKKNTSSKYPSKDKEFTVKKYELIWANLYMEINNLLTSWESICNFKSCGDYNNDTSDEGDYGVQFNDNGQYGLVGDCNYTCYSNIWENDLMDYGTYGGDNA